LFGDELIEIVISSAPSLLNKEDQPSSGKPLTASLKPLQIEKSLDFRPVVAKNGMLLQDTLADAWKVKRLFHLFTHLLSL
jgi:hypothetical protein